MTTKTAPIVIAGGGIAGLIAAVGLQRRGTEVVVLERQPEVRHQGAGLSLWPNALAALDVLGLGRLVREIGQSLASVGQRKLDGRTGATCSVKGFTRSLGEGLVCVDRGQLTESLAALLAPGTVRTRSAVTGYRPEPTSIMVEVEGAERIEAAGLIGADGINSAVGSQMNGSLDFAYSGYTAWRGIAETIFEPDRDRMWGCVAQGHEV